MTNSKEKNTQRNVNRKKKKKFLRSFKLVGMMKPAFRYGTSNGYITHWTSSQYDPLRQQKELERIKAKTLYGSWQDRYVWVKEYYCPSGKGGNRSTEELRSVWMPQHGEMTAIEYEKRLREKTLYTNQTRAFEKSNNFINLYIICRDVDVEGLLARGFKKHPVSLSVSGLDELTGELDISIALNRAKEILQSEPFAGIFHTAILYDPHVFGKELARMDWQGHIKSFVDKDFEEKIRLSTKFIAFQPGIGENINP